ncbi:DUF397 domain-containing protein [Streptomycetaceae bacterium NBC_01309]
MILGQTTDPVGWRKSSYSGGSGGECVEVATSSAALVPVRDSKDVARGFITVPARAWISFAGSLK